MDLRNQIHDWDGEKTLFEVERERLANTKETAVSLGNSYLTAAYPTAIVRVIQLACFSESEHLRGLHARYIIDKVGELAKGNGEDPLLKFMNEVSDFANTNSTYRPERED